MKKRILILEDDIGTADLLKFYFEEEDLLVQLCFTAKEFYTQIEKFNPDLITIDILLTDANGIDILKELQSSDKTSGIPVLLISIKESDRKKGLQLGALGFFGKPINEYALKETVNDILKNR